MKSYKIAKKKKVSMFVFFLCLVMVMITFLNKPLMVLGAKVGFVGITHYQIVVDGRVEDIYTFEKDIEKVTRKGNIKLENLDYLSTKTLDKKTEVEVVRSYEELIHKKESLPYEKIVKEDNQLEKGVNKVQQAGEEGSVVTEHIVIYNNGEKKEKHKISETITKPPQDEVVIKGTKEVVVMKPNITKVSRGNSSSKKVVSMTATAYTHTGNKTATGIYPYVGVIAVDPKVIPLGTRVYVEGYGNAIAADTGGAIKGNIIDVFFDSRDECINWGRKTVEVKILD